MEKWWRKHFRMIQYNLQVKDAPLMDSEQIAKDTEALNANVVVMNVGGIYAWYPTKVPFHYLNEYFPEGRDLIKELIETMHVSVPLRGREFRNPMPLNPSIYAASEGHCVIFLYELLTGWIPGFIDRRL